ncbi:MAG: hypothetical protein Q9225_006294 [Loekoesia sp. 1 TL-2023]
MAAPASNVEVEPGIEASSVCSPLNYVFTCHQELTAEVVRRRARFCLRLRSKETERLDIMHRMTEVSLGGKLNLAPIPKNAKRILDVGTGTGIWAIETGMTGIRDS